MQRIIEYTLFFIGMMLLQLFLFNNLNLSVYVNPLIYVAFLIFLPMEIPPVFMLLLGLCSGVGMDLLMGTAGINTAASLATGYLRNTVLVLVAGKEEVREGGIPSRSRLGTGKFLRYLAIMVFIHCFVFFALESPSPKYFHLTLLRILLSSLATAVAVYFAGMLLPGVTARKSRF